jgi:flagellar hook-associated protein 1
MQQQQANVIAGNIANANSPGYATETLPQLEQAFGDSVGVSAGLLQRLSNEALSATANQTNGAQAYGQAMVNALTNYTNVLGQSSDSSSLPEQFSAFSQALTSLSASPDEASLQSGAAQAAQSLVGTLNTLSTTVQSGREQADQTIASDVSTVNQTLGQLAQNQSAMLTAQAQGQPIASYQDAQGQLLSTLSTYLPIQVTQHSNGGITVATDGGTTLLDGGTVNDLSFTPASTITPQMQVTADPANGYTGGLSAVTVDGQPIAISQNGDIAAQLQLRDVTLPAFGQQLDQLAGNLITAFQQADPTVGSGQTGLFTDAGAAVNPNDPAQVPGLAANISLNASVDPNQGGQVWRIVQGAQATTESAETSDNSTLLAFIQGLNTDQTYSSSTGLSGSMPLTNAVSEIAGRQQAALSTWTSNNTSATAQAQTAQTALSNATGVNVDDQMQQLITVQATYAATTQVIQAASKMIDDLNNITLT